MSIISVKAKIPIIVHFLEYIDANNLQCNKVIFDELFWWEKREIKNAIYQWILLGRTQIV